MKVDPSLSPYIQADIRKRQLEQQQQRILDATLTELGKTDDDLYDQRMLLRHGPCSPPRDQPWLIETPEQRAERRIQSKITQRARQYRQRAKKLGAQADLVVRHEIIERDASTCYLCGKTCQPSDIHLDHVIPLSRGGHHTADNIKVSCAQCNLSKGTLTAEEYRAARSVRALR